MNIRRKNPDEIVLAEFDFTLDLNDVPGTTIAGAVMEVDLLTGVDPAPDLLEGLPIMGVGAVAQHIKGGADGCRYKVRCLATLSDGRIVARARYFDVANP